MLSPYLLFPSVLQKLIKLWGSNTAKCMHDSNAPPHNLNIITNVRPDKGTWYLLGAQRFPRKLNDQNLLYDVLMYNVCPNISLVWWQRWNHKSLVSAALLDKLYFLKSWDWIRAVAKEGITTGETPLFFKCIHALLSSSALILNVLGSSAQNGLLK